MRDEADWRGGGNDMRAEGAGAGWEGSLSAGMCREGVKGRSRGQDGAERGGTGRRDGAEETLSGAKREKAEEGRGSNRDARRGTGRERDGGLAEWARTKQSA